MTDLLSSEQSFQAVAISSTYTCGIANEFKWYASRRINRFEGGSAITDGILTNAKGIKEPFRAISGYTVTIDTKSINDVNRVRVAKIKWTYKRLIWI